MLVSGHSFFDLNNNNNEYQHGCCFQKCEHLEFSVYARTFFKELAHVINRYGKTDASRDFHAVDADRFAVQIDERSA